MATSFDKNDRRAVVDEMRRRQQRAEKRRSFTILGACLLVAFLIVAAAAFPLVKNWWDLRQFESYAMSEIGAPATVCGEVTKKDAQGNQDHVPVGTHVLYPDAPPAFGQHWSEWDTIERKLYTKSDRPGLGMLVHNLEHGYTMVWYDETVAGDDEQMGQLRGLADKIAEAPGFRAKVKIVPWTSDDGAAFPEGQHVAFTHWSAGSGQDGSGKQEGVWQYCSAVSGAGLEEFTLDYPYTDSPEPTVE